MNPKIHQHARPDAWVRDPCVIQTDGGYRMFHIGKGSSDLQGIMSGKPGMWLGTSPDGLVWDYQPDDPPPPDEHSVTDYRYSANRINAPWILLEEGSYHIWFTHFDGNNRRINYTRFDVDTNQVGPFKMEKGLALYHETDLSDPTVVRTESGHMMAFTRGDSLEKRIGFAYSNQTGVWAQDIDYATDLWPGEAPAWDSRIIWCPTLMYDQTGYTLWYLGTDGTTVDMGMAQSTDGVVWHKVSQERRFTLGRYTGIEQVENWSITVVAAHHSFTLFYTTPEDFQIGRADSSDGLSWRQSDPINLDTTFETAPGRVAALSSSAGFELGRICRTDKDFLLLNFASPNDLEWTLTHSLNFRIRRDHAASSWENLDTARPSVIQKDGKYHIWYAGASRFDVYDQMIWQIGYAIADGNRPMESYPDNPVLTIGPPDSWDSVYVTDPSVYWDGQAYRMWYAGFDGKVYCIGCAVSEDGITWEKDPENPIFSPLPGSWEEDEVRYPCVLFQDGRYHMWYRGRRELQAGIGYASSDDGRTWRRSDRNPVLESDTASQWDSGQLECPSVLRQGNGYRMWYTGFDWKTWRIGHASSENGLQWDKTAGGPVLSAEPATAWDLHHVQSPCIVRTPDGYRMWYTGMRGVQTQIGTAVSPDGNMWTLDDHNPVITPKTKGWDSLQIDLPSVVYHDGVYRMWFSGFDGFHWRIGFAVSEDGVSWRRHPDPILEGGETGWDSDGVWNPSVVWDGRQYMMWYAGTRRSIPFQDRNAIANHVNQGCDIGLATSIDGLVWTRHESSPVIQEADSPCVVYHNGLYRMWYNIIPRNKVVTTVPPLYYTTSQDGISWRSDKIMIPPPAFALGLRHSSVLLSENHYRLWYDSTTFESQIRRHICGLQAEALDIAHIKLHDLRIMETRPHGDWAELLLEPSFLNEGPGDAQDVKIMLKEIESGVRSLSPNPTLHIGDLETGQTACAEPLRLLVQEAPGSTADLKLHWRISYTDTVMGDRQHYETS